MKSSENVVFRVLKQLCTVCIIAAVLGATIMMRSRETPAPYSDLLLSEVSNVVMTNLKSAEIMMFETSSGTGDGYEFAVLEVQSDVALAIERNLKGGMSPWKWKTGLIPSDVLNRCFRADGPSKGYVYRTELVDEPVRYSIRDESPLNQPLHNVALIAFNLKTRKIYYSKWFM